MVERRWPGQPLWRRIVLADWRLEIDEVTDIRYLDNKDRTKDRDGLPITRKFSKTDRTQLQRIAWDAFSQFQNTRSGAED